MIKEFAPYELALKLKELGFDEECMGFYTEEYKYLTINRCKYPIDLPTKPFLAPLWQQATKFLYICSNGKINIEINGKDNYEELCKKLNKAIEDFRNL